jgi:hypothetical protein
MPRHRTPESMPHKIQSINCRGIPRPSCFLVHPALAQLARPTATAKRTGTRSTAPAEPWSFSPRPSPAGGSRRTSLPFCRAPWAGTRRRNPPRQGGGVLFAARAPPAALRDEPPVLREADRPKPKPSPSLLICLDQHKFDKYIKNYIGDF